MRANEGLGKGPFMCSIAAAAISALAQSVKSPEGLAISNVDCRHQWIVGSFNAHCDSCSEVLALHGVREAKVIETYWA
jgi:hypothetical protein